MSFIFAFFAFAKFSVEQSTPHIGVIDEIRNTPEYIEGTTQHFFTIDTAFHE